MSTTPGGIRLPYSGGIREVRPPLGFPASPIADHVFAFLVLLGDAIEKFFKIFSFKPQKNLQNLGPVLNSSF